MAAKKKPTACGNAAGLRRHEPTIAHDGAIVADQEDTGKPTKLPTFKPRQARVLDALLPGHWVEREPLDRIAGSSNGPDVVWKLRHKIGVDAIEMELIDGTDRDGKPCRTGRYRLTEPGRARLVDLGLSVSVGGSAA